MRSVLFHSSLYWLVGLLLSLLFHTSVYAQSGYVGDGPVKWENNLAPVMPADIDSFAKSDLVILYEVSDFYFFDISNEKLIRNVKYKINNEKGLQALKHFHLPESFDPAFDQAIHLQGRRSRITQPYIKEYNMNEFAARRYSHNRWYPISLKESFEQIRWIKNNGEFSDEDVPVVNMQGLTVGDVVEIYYEATFNTAYGSNLFYLHARYPKISCEYNFIVKSPTQPDSTNFILPLNIPNMYVSKLTRKINNQTSTTTKIKMPYLAGINYPGHAAPGQQLPHVVADFLFYRSYQLTSRLSPYQPTKSNHFDWLITTEVPNPNSTKIYDKNSAAIRKFLSTLPPTGNDTLNYTFVKNLCDTLNAFRYLSANQLYYNESNLAGVYSAEHLLKRRLPGEYLWKIYLDIFNEKNISFYLVNILDKRLGEHSYKYRAHRAYENTLLALPYRNTYIYFMPRYAGQAYHLNELPFYLEGVKAAFTPINMSSSAESKNEKVFKIIQTHHGTYNENSRTENATVLVNPDSLSVSLNIKESLSGQFSTLLRHLYQHHNIDSTVHPHYFKKCVDKPGAYDIRIKQSSELSEYPFRVNLMCTERLSIPKAKPMSLSEWFSFPLSEKLIPEKPNHDYYFDFEFSDTYHYLISFTKPCRILNIDEFNSRMSNEYFDLTSGLTENPNGTYLWSVSLVCKQDKILLKDMNLLMVLVKELDRLNHLQLQYSGL